MTITNGYCTLAEFKAYEKIGSTDSTDDGVIEDIIEAQSRLIDDITNRTFYARTETHKFNTPIPFDLTLYMDDDLISVTSIANGSGTAVTSGQYVLLSPNVSPKYAIQILFSAGIFWEFSAAGDPQQAITVVGSWGYTTTAPDDIKSACLMMASAEYHRRFGENVSGTATITAAGVVITPQGVPKAAMDIINNYVRVVY